MRRTDRIDTELSLESVPYLRDLELAGNRCPPRCHDRHVEATGVARRPEVDVGGCPPAWEGADAVVVSASGARVRQRGVAAAAG